LVIVQWSCAAECGGGLTERGKSRRCRSQSLRIARETRRHAVSRQRQFVVPRARRRQLHKGHRGDGGSRILHRTHNGGDGARTGVTSENTSILAGVGAGQGAEGDDFEELLSSEEKNASEKSETADDSTYTIVDGSRKRTTCIGYAKTNISIWIYHFSREQ